MVLHRVVLQSRGKPLWAYDTDEQLFHGLLDTLSGTFRTFRVAMRLTHTF